MNRRLKLFGLAAALAVGLSVNFSPQAGPSFAVAKADTQASFNVVFSSLDRYGSWVNRDNAYVWVPASVGPNWKPYTNGHWVYTDRFGWYFESDEPFAQIVYHYGRWAF